MEEEKERFIGDGSDPAEDARVLAKYTEVGIHPEKTVLLATSGGIPVRIDEVDGAGKWMVAFSEREDIPLGMKEVNVVPSGDVLRMQEKARIGEGIVLDPYTDPLWIPNGMIPVLLDGGRTENYPIEVPSTEEGKEAEEKAKE